MTTDDLDINLLSPERLAPEVVESLESALGMALVTHWAHIYPAHLALALLTSEDNRFDTLLSECCAGLQTATIIESLLVDLLEIEADAGKNNNSKLPNQGPLQVAHFSPEALTALRRAKELAATWQTPQMTILALACALFEQPDRFLATVFRDAGIGPPTLQALADRLRESAQGRASVELPPVFNEGHLNLEAFGPLAQAALQELGRLAPERVLRDLDLLSCLLEQPDSRLLEALHVLGLSTTNIRRSLAKLTTITKATNSAPDFNEQRFGRLLQRVLKEAAKLAGHERCTRIAESHLIRAHLERVAAGTDNVYQKLGIDTQRLHAYLARYTSDSEAKQMPPPLSSSGMIQNIEGYLRARIIYQDQAISRVVPALQRMQSGLGEPGRLIGIFLFLGATGVGKTELARAIADVIFGPKPGVRDPYLIHIDCTHIQEKHNISRVLGAPPGYVGYKEGKLTNSLKDKPKAVILFDEVEKAHPNLWQSLLRLFDEGIVEEADGTEHDATGCILVGTSNLGYKEAMESFKLREASPEQFEAQRQEVEKSVWKKVEDYFSPEFLGRIGRENVIFFNHLDRPSYQQIITLQVQSLVKEMAERRGFQVAVTGAVIELLTEFAWQKRAEGARPVRRLITDHLRNQLSTAVTSDPGRTHFAFDALEGSGAIILRN